MNKSMKKGGKMQNESEKIKEALNKQLEEQQIILDSIPAWVFYKDKENRFIRVNNTFAEVMGIPKEELEGKSLFDIFPKEQAEAFLEDDLAVIASGKPKRNIIESMLSPKGTLWVKTDKIPYYDEQGNVIGIIGFTLDITEQRKAEERIKRESKRVASINEIFLKRITSETVEELGQKCLAVAEKLTGSKFGYIGELNNVGSFDTIAISNPGWDACNVPPNEAMLKITNMPLRGIDRSALIEGKSRIVNEDEFASHPDRVGLPEGHPPMTAFLGVPLKDGNKTIGMIGLGNKESGYDVSDQEAIEAITVAIVEALKSKRAEDTMSRQSQEILELSTPVIDVWDGIVIAPLIGTLDSERTQRFMEQLLNRIVNTHSSVALVDITGVTAVDTQTAQHLIETITAVRLLGAQVILTGVRPSIAQTIIHLGIDLSDITTHSSMAEGLRIAFKMIDVEVVSKNKSS